MKFANAPLSVTAKLENKVYLFESYYRLYHLVIILRWVDHLPATPQGEVTGDNQRCNFGEKICPRCAVLDSTRGLKLVLLSHLSCLA